ncbi:hypothetical protein [Haloferula sp. BvORR071]|uniref:hypothetical protein n=1 Tax=Haloferula sp. BvORR071 TaxID=1396141 RepID=UPI00054F6CEA|nr:hypothetical protein [Haloferula sp. BvORR071]
MRSLPYLTLRRIQALGAMAFMLAYFGSDFIAPGVLRTMFIVLFGLIAGASVVFLVWAGVLGRLGRLEFSYAEKDFRSAYYKAEKLHELMQATRRSKKGG